MKLSTLVAYKHKLQKHNSELLTKSLDEILCLISAEISDTDFLNLFTTKKADLLKATEEFHMFYQDYINTIKKQIIHDEQEYIASSFDRYNNPPYLANPSGGIEHYRLQELVIDNDTRQYLKGRIEKYVAWSIPGLQLAPGYGDLTDCMVSLDPLYLVDYYDQLIQPVRIKYPEAYQYRLRSYTIPKYFKGRKSLTQLPQNQFGFILAYNFFDLLPLEGIEEILKECFDLLRPGGTILFTFNDCDQSHNVHFVEINHRFYTPARLVKKILNSLGFKILNHHYESYGIAWFEASKPGDLVAVRSSQALAKVERYEIGETKK